MRPSLWTAEPAPLPNPPLAGDVEADVCVVGGGLAGLLTALMLAHGQLRVVLVEAHRLGQGTTGRSTAKVTVLQGTRLSEVAHRHSAELAQAYLGANLEGQAWLRRFCEDHAVGYEVRTAYTCATTERGEQQARSEGDLLRSAGVEASWLADTGLPLPHRGGIGVADQGQVDPAALVARLARDAVAHGVEIHEETRATGVHHHGKGVRVETPWGNVLARHAVIATNAPIHDVTGFFARQSATRSHVAAFLSDWEPPGMYLTVDAEPRSVRGAQHDGQRVVIVAGGGHLTGAKRPLEALEGLVRAARALPLGAEVAAWSAQDQSPEGHLPFAGRLVPRDDRVLVVTGFEKWGFALAPAAALLLSCHLLGGNRPRWGTAFSTWSTREARALPRLLQHNGRVACQLATGHLARFALSDKPPLCTHLGGVLVPNDTEETWDCPLHGSRFAADGTVLEGPAVRSLHD